MAINEGLQSIPDSALMVRVETDALYVVNLLNSKEQDETEFL